MNQSIMGKMEKLYKEEKRKWIRELLITVVEVLFMGLVLSSLVRTGYVAEDRILPAMIIILTFIALITYIKGLLSKDFDVRTIDLWIGLSVMMAGLTLRFGMNIFG